MSNRLRARSRCWGGAGATPLILPNYIAPSLTFSRASSARMLSGLALSSYATDVPRIDVAGRLLVEGDRTNLVRNPNFEYAATPTFPTATLPTNMAGTVGLGWTRTVVGQTTLNGVTYLDVRFVAAALTTQTCDVTFDTGMVIAAGVPNAGLFYCAMVAGSKAGIGLIQPRMALTGASPANGADITPFLTSTPQPFGHVATATSGPGSWTIRLSTNTLDSVDITLRFALVQFEAGVSFNSSPMLPVSPAVAATSRSRDQMSGLLATMGLAGPYLAFFGQALVGQPSPAGVDQTIFQLCDGTDASRYWLRIAAGGSGVVAGRTIGGVAADSASIGAMTPGTSFAWALVIDLTSGSMRALISGGVERTVSGGPTSAMTAYRFGSTVTAGASLFGATGAAVVRYASPAADLPSLLAQADAFWSPSTQARMALEAARVSTASATPVDASLQALDADILILLAFGQSNTYGSQASPQLTLSTAAGALMFGDTERPGSTTGTSWTTKGTPAFNALIATCLGEDGVTLLSQADAAALPPTANTIGESVTDAAVSYLRQAQLDATGISVGARRILLVNVGVPGTSVAQLSRGASPEYFNRVPTALAAVKAFADGLGLTTRLAAVVWNQGEADYGLNTPIATYKAAVVTLMNDIATYGAQGVLGQTRPFNIAIVQTASGGVIGNGTVSISEAQRQLANERGYAIVRRVGTSKGLHEDPNGARWVGSHLGFALRDAIVRRQRWVAVQPTDAACSASGRYIYLPFQTPAILAAHDYYSQYALVSNVHRGLTAVDSAGQLNITAVEVVNGYLLRVTVDRNLTGSAVQVDSGWRNISFGDNGIFAQYAGPTALSYQFLTGMDPAANIPALVGNPYPSEVPSLLFSVSVPVA